VYRAKGFVPMNFYEPLSRLRELDALAADDAVEFIIRQGQALRDRGATGSTSMFEDLLRRRKMEVDDIIKPFVDEAASLGIDVPTLQGAYRVTKTIDSFLS
jgi:2-dehydropantoate 2-reductase